MIGSLAWSRSPPRQQQTAPILAPAPRQTSARLPSRSPGISAPRREGRTPGVKNLAEFSAAERDADFGAGALASL
eukprot:2717621-Prymnesium_polylepis.1